MFSVPMLVAIGIVIVLFCAAWANNPDFFREWQTLITGLLTVIAASFGLYGIQRQIVASQELEASRLSGQLASARVVMPLALSETMNYINKCSRFVEQLAQNEVTPETWQSTIRGADLDLPQGSIEVFRRIAESVSGAQERAAIWTLIAALQVQNSRLLDRRRPPNRIEAGDRALDVIELHAYCASLFAFSRGEAASLSIPVLSAEVLRSSARLLAMSSAVLAAGDDALTRRSRDGLIESLARAHIRR